MAQFGGRISRILGNYTYIST